MKTSIWDAEEYCEKCHQLKAYIYFFFFQERCFQSFCTLLDVLLKITFLL